MYFKTEHSLKKVISLIFLLLAGMIILAHAVIPHHHHNGISFISSTTHHTNDDEQNDTQEICLLSKVYLRLSNDKQTFQLYNFDFDLLPYLLTLFSDENIPPIDDTTSLLFRHQPYILLNYTKFIACSKGLRAPPFQLRITN